jgi:hypothetical protein
MSEIHDHDPIGLIVGLISGVGAVAIILIIYLCKRKRKIIEKENKEKRILKYLEKRKSLRTLNNESIKLKINDSCIINKKMGIALNGTGISNTNDLINNGSSCDWGSSNFMLASKLRNENKNFLKISNNYGCNTRFNKITEKSSENTTEISDIKNLKSPSRSNYSHNISKISTNKNLIDVMDPNNNPDNKFEGIVCLPETWEMYNKNFISVRGENNNEKQNDDICIKSNSNDQIDEREIVNKVLTIESNFEEVQLN